MASVPPEPSDVDHPRHNRSYRAAPRTPRWVVVLGAIALLLILAFVVQLVLGLGHGPGMHAWALV